MEATKREYAIRTDDLIAAGEVRELRVTVEKRCRSARLIVDREVEYLFGVEVIRLGGRGTTTGSSSRSPSRGTRRGRR